MTPHIIRQSAAYMRRSLRALVARLCRKCSFFNSTCASLSLRTVSYGLVSVCLSEVSVLSVRLKEPSRFGHMTALSSTYPTLCYKTRYRPAAAETICSLPMAVLSKNRSPHISGGRRRLSCRQPACLWPRQLRWDRETDGSRYSKMPPLGVLPSPT